MPIDFPKFSRPSKLKRKRKTQPVSSTTSTNKNPLAQFSASSVSTVQSKNKQLTSPSNDDAAKHASVNVRGMNTSQDSLPRASTLLDLYAGPTQYPWNNAKAVSAQIDYCIALSSTNQNSARNYCNDGIQGENVNVSAHHPILESVDLRHRSSGEHSGNFPLAFPNLNVADNIECNDLYRRGDGTSVSSTCLSLPGVSIMINDAKDPSQSQHHSKYIKIVSQLGATIRTHCEIDENNDESMRIGKLRLGAIRPIMESKYLDPPPIILDMAEDDREYDEKLVDVIRYKVRLLPSDISQNNDLKGKDFEMDHYRSGWISDRSRLEDDPYAIAEVQE